MRTRKFFAALAAFVFFQILGRNCDGQILAVDSSQGSTYEASDLGAFPSGATFGWRFTVGASPISVTGLGVLDADQDGLSTSYQVGIWDLDGNLVVQTSVQAGTDSTLEGDYRFEIVGPQTLSANGSYVIGAYSPTPDDLAVLNGPAQPHPSDIFYFGSSRSSGNSFAPPLIGEGHQGVFGANFEYSAVPEPRAYAMITGIGLIGFAALRKRFARGQRS